MYFTGTVDHEHSGHNCLRIALDVSVRFGGHEHNLFSRSTHDSGTVAHQSLLTTTLNICKSVVECLGSGNFSIQYFTRNLQRLQKHVPMILYLSVEVEEQEIFLPMEAALLF
jgi:hypothetical protein